MEYPPPWRSPQEKEFSAAPADGVYSGHAEYVIFTDLARGQAS
jgi:hypothetical protein